MWLNGHDADDYASKNAGAVFSHVRNGTPFESTNLPEGYKHEDWTIETMLSKEGSKVDSNFYNVKNSWIFAQNQLLTPYDVISRAQIVAGTNSERSSKLDYDEQELFIKSLFAIYIWWRIGISTDTSPCYKSAIHI